jgi:hypothetical protein
VAVVGLMEDFFIINLLLVVSQFYDDLKDA